MSFANFPCKEGMHCLQKILFECMLFFHVAASKWHFNNGFPFINYYYPRKVS